MHVISLFLTFIGASKRYAALLIAGLANCLCSCAVVSSTPQLPANWIPYTAELKSNFGRIAIMSTQTGESRILTDDYLGRAPQLSTDRTRIVFGAPNAEALTRLNEGDQPGANDIDLHVIDLDGTTIWSHLSSGQDYRQIKWSPASNNQLAWIEDFSLLHVATFSDNNVMTVPFDYIDEFAWHPSGTFITVVVNNALQDVMLDTGAIVPRLDVADLLPNTTIRHVDWFHHSDHYLFTVERNIGCESKNFFECDPDEIWVHGETLAVPQRLITAAGIANIAPDDKSVAFSEGVLWRDVCAVGHRFSILRLSDTFFVEKVLTDWQYPLAAQGLYPLDVSTGAWVSNDTFTTVAQNVCGFTTTSTADYLFDANTLTITQLNANGRAFDPKQNTLTDKIVAAGGNAQQLVAFVRSSKAEQPDGDIVLMQADGSAYTVLTTGEANQDAVLSADGAYIAYRQLVSTPGATDETNPQYDIWIWSVVEGAARKITDSVAYRTAPAISPDGQWLVYGEDQTLVQHDLHQDTKVITNDAAITPTYAADGRSIWYITPDQQLTRLDLETGEPSVIGSRVQQHENHEITYYAVQDARFQGKVFEIYTDPTVPIDPLSAQTGASIYRARPSATVAEDLASILPGNRSSLWLESPTDLQTCMPHNALLFYSPHVHHTTEISYAQFASDDADLAQLSISRNVPIQPLSDRAVLIYLEHPCVDAAASKQGWYFFDFVTKQVDLVRLDADAD